MSRAARSLSVARAVGRSGSRSRARRPPHGGRRGEGETEAGGLVVEALAAGGEPRQGGGHADEGDPAVAAGGEVAGDLGGGGHVVDVGPVLWEAGPGAAEGGEGDADPGGVGGAGVVGEDVGEDQAVDLAGRHHSVDHRPDVLLPRRRAEEQDVVADGPGRVDEGFEEARHQRIGVEGVVDRGEVADGAALAGAQRPGGLVGPVPEPLDRRVDPGEGVGADPVRGVECVGDGLPGHLGRPGHVRDGGDAARGANSRGGHRFSFTWVPPRRAPAVRPGGGSADRPAGRRRGRRPDGRSRCRRSGRGRPGRLPRRCPGRR